MFDDDDEDYEDEDDAPIPGRPAKPSRTTAKKEATKTPEKKGGPDERPLRSPWRGTATRRRFGRYLELVREFSPNALRAVRGHSSGVTSFATRSRSKAGASGSSAVTRSPRLAGRPPRPARARP